MIPNKVLAAFSSAAMLVAVSTSVAKEKSNLPDITEDGLHLVQGTTLAAVYADPEADFSGYRRVQLADAAIAFRKDWLRDQRSRSAGSMRITHRDVERIKGELAEEFHKVFAETLVNGGYELTEEVAEDVLIVRPAIINLDVTAPDTHNIGRSQTYAKSAGEMTLYLELYDAVTGDLLAKAMDRQGDRDSQIYTWVTPSTNKAMAERIIRGWAEVLVAGLDEARGKTAEE